MSYMHTNLNVLFFDGSVRDISQICFLSCKDANLWNSQSLLSFMLSEWLLVNAMISAEYFCSKLAECIQD